MSAQAQIEKLRSIQESLHEIADKVVSLGDGSVMLNDVAEGKKQIAEAINIKGGNSNENESFAELAEDIRNLDDTFITYGVTTNGNKIDWLDILCDKKSNYTYNVLKIVNSTVKEINSNNTFTSFINMQEVCMESVLHINATATFNDCISLQKLSFPNNISLTGNNAFNKCTNLIEINMPSITSISGTNHTTGTLNLKNITLGALTSMSAWINSKQDSLENITVGQGTDADLPFQNWTATNVINEGQSGIDELNENLYNNLLTKLYDHSEDGETRTLRLGWLAHVTQENIDYANSKGWTLTT